MAETYEQVEQQRNHFRREVTALSKQVEELSVYEGMYSLAQKDNRELTRQVEQLRAEREVDRKDAEAWRRSRIVGRCGHCHEEFESSSALIEHMGPGELDLPKCSFAPPSSSDPGRADTGREEK